MVCEDKVYYREVLFVKIGLLLESLNILIYVKQQGPVAQWIEQQPSKLRVKGSSPFWITHKIRDVVQLVVCVLWEHEVAGSSPVIPT